MTRAAGSTWSWPTHLGLSELGVRLVELPLGNAHRTGGGQSRACRLIGCLLARGLHILLGERHVRLRSGDRILGGLQLGLGKPHLSLGSHARRLEPLLAARIRGLDRVAVVL